ncbi:MULTISPECIES: NADH-quinone oxidoreductase subunit 5 family protein [Sphingobacterium]|uniref:NADH-quinone oxidoreductase subunit 5 family protein n=1 Tax=Sphingobacterium TaxID=28453 RepID=UPI000E8BDE65|nr:NADH-quinone oxidoreductase subunit L [Sphingobacterium multivorum]HAU51922.1 NADH-quinone oxidoreductase subunit L [Sphingobacterium sp.]HCX58400.1 NADH-quinone oxidoreductase subunit L [Sphingobacterium sp.]
MDQFVHISPLLTALLTLIAPLAAFVYQAIVGKRDQSGLVSLTAIILSFIAGGLTWFSIWNNPAVSIQVNWFTIGETSFKVGILLNNLSTLMLFLVPTVALPVHIYSRAYMHGDTGIHRYWMYLSLFCFAMLGLVIMDSLLLMYVFWELVGFASYLLIGFWFTRETAVQANKKAFLVNRIGDLGFLIGLAILFTQFKTLNLIDLFGDNGLIYQSTIAQGLWISPVNSLPQIWLTIAGLAFFLAAMAKSAQFPLHVWLPDAMEGPTSVSSLIHAATMVAAGVFLLATVFPLFNESALLFIAIIGTITAALAAYFALGQYDIKRILAFSTISQLGFMMVGIGIGTWDAALFHLTTHAFFKCLLFLSAGAVIHEMAHLKEHSHLDFDPQDLRNMGGLRQYMPKTFVLMSIASLALAGFPLTSGYLSKDSIVISSFEWAISKGNLYLIIPISLILVSILTAFYIGRLLFKAFFGEFRLLKQLQGKLHDQPLHEAPKTMLIPMFVLGLFCLFPLFSFNPFSYHDSWLMDGLLLDEYSFAPSHSAHLIIPVILLLGSGIGWIIGWKWYVQNKYPLNAASQGLKAAFNQGYINEFYQAVFVNGTLKLAQFCYWFDLHIVDALISLIQFIVLSLSQLSVWIDKYIVDGFVNTVATVAYWTGNQVRLVQNGKIQTTLYSVFLLVLLGLIYLIFF